MPEKCSVVGCKSGYLNGPKSPRFRFPPPSHYELRAKWILFLNQPDYEVTANCGFVLITLMLNTLKSMNVEPD